MVVAAARWRRCDERFTAGAAAALRDAIVDAGGNEVFLLGIVDDGLGHRRARPGARQPARRAGAPAGAAARRGGHPQSSERRAARRPTPTSPSPRRSATTASAPTSSTTRSSEVYVVVEPHAAPAPTAARRGRRRRAARHRTAPSAPPSTATSTGRSSSRCCAPSPPRSTTTSVLTVEAGTGTGKSLAYLVPAILWSRATASASSSRPTPSTCRSSWSRKDLPLLDRSAPASSARRRWSRGAATTSASARRRRSTRRAPAGRGRAARRAARGARLGASRPATAASAISPVRPRPEVWEQVVSENDNCLRARCPYYSTCFFYTRAARRRGGRHHRRQPSPADGRSGAARRDRQLHAERASCRRRRASIIDEAHHLEDVATSYFGAPGEPGDDRARLRPPAEPAQPGKGVLPALALALECGRRSPTTRRSPRGAAQWIDSRLLAAPPAVARRRRAMLRPSCCADARDAAAAATAATRDEKLRVTEAVRESAFWRELVERADAPRHGARRLRRRLRRRARAHRAARPRTSRTQVRYLDTELGAMHGRLAGAGRGAARRSPRTTTRTAPGSSCRERAARRSSRCRCTAPRSPSAPLLRAALFEPFATVVLTSATLAVDRRFDYLHQRVGVDARRRCPSACDTLRVESPFDFAAPGAAGGARRPARADAPGLRGGHARGHAPHRSRVDATAARSCSSPPTARSTAPGSTLAERAARARADRRCARASSAATCCCGASSHDPRAVLFATDSFWEGVDVRGDALRCVIITRLPFRVPTEPIEQARVEAIAARGGDPFAEHAAAAGRDQAEAGLRPPDPQPHRPRLRRRARQPHRDASATARSSSRAAAGETGDRRDERCAGGGGGVLRRSRAAIVGAVGSRHAARCIPRDVREGARAKDIGASAPRVRVRSAGRSLTSPALRRAQAERRATQGGRPRRRGLARRGRQGWLTPRAVGVSRVRPVSPAGRRCPGASTAAPSARSARRAPSTARAA